MSIEKLLVESKNSSGLKQIQGLVSELRVAQHFHQRNYYLIEHRLKTPFSEVDLLIENHKNEIAIVEVKTINQIDWVEERISRHQRQRLIRASLWLQEQRQQTCILLGAFVENKQIKIYLLD